MASKHLWEYWIEPLAARRLIQTRLLAFCLLASVVWHIGFPAACMEAQNVTSALAQTSRPNFLIIITDDQGHPNQTLNRRFMPRTRSMIIDQGVLFSRGFCTTPLCSPSRASIFTGRYARHHGMLTNGGLLAETTFYDRLRAAGYYTGLVGKTLPAPLSKFDVTVALKISLQVQDPYINPQVRINGQWQTVPGYTTFILRDQALRFLDQVPNNQPFLLFFTPNAPHIPATPAPGDENLFEDISPFRPPSFNEPDVSDKPAWLQTKLPFGPRMIAYIDNLRIRQFQTLKRVDDAISALLTLLKQQGKLDHTVVLFIGDNGVYWGEHRLINKSRVYESAIQVPFALRYPPLVSGPKVNGDLVANIDIAPTIYELAGLPIPSNVDGLSLVPRLQGRGGWRDALLIEGVPEPALFDQRFEAVRTKRYVYVETIGYRSELYDLNIDPHQLENVVDNPSYAGIVKMLSERLRQF